jgi:hypothetical protein
VVGEYPRTVVGETCPNSLSLDSLWCVVASEHVSSNGVAVPIDGYRVRGRRLASRMGMAICDNLTVIRDPLPSWLHPSAAESLKLRG